MQIILTGIDVPILTEILQEIKAMSGLLEALTVVAGRAIESQKAAIEAIKTLTDQLALKEGSVTPVEVQPILDDLNKSTEELTAALPVAPTPIP